MLLQKNKKRRKQSFTMVEDREEESSSSHNLTTSFAKSRQRSNQQKASCHQIFRRYIYSAITATFLFVVFRELGLVDEINTNLQQQSYVIRRNDVKVNGRSVAALSNLAATSMTVGQKLSPDASKPSGLSDSAHSQMARAEIMDRAIMEDRSIVAGSRPVIYTFFEWIPLHNRGSISSDEADKLILLEWKAAWKKAGWHPVVLTLQDAKKHPDYDAYNTRLTNVGASAIMYNQLCYLRWLAVAAKGGGFMSDYDVFPVSLAPKTLEIPYDGKFAVYCKMKPSNNAGTPCLMSGSAEEWTRMAHAVLENHEKHADRETIWSDMLSLIDMRDTANYSVHDSVLEGQDVLLRRKWSELDCEVTAQKHAVHFSHKSFKLGYLPPGKNMEDRPAIVRQFLEAWERNCYHLQNEKEPIGSDE